MKNRTAAFLLGLVVICWPPAPAHASWTSSAAGSAIATAATIAPPTELVATCGGLQATVKLDWTATASTWADGYEVRWGTSPGVYSSSSTVTTPSLTTPSLSLGTHYFSVRAIRGEWRSADSNEVSKTIDSVVGLATCL